jgi:hypothetical protein
MAKATAQVIQVLRKTASKLSKSNSYQWGHMGACNCGFLAQEITRKEKRDIHASAMIGHGDWSEQLNDYCPTSGLPMDEIISEMTRFGFDIDDLIQLEKLSNVSILSRVNEPLRHNLKKDVVRYMETWAALLEDEMVDEISLSNVYTEEVVLV